MKTKVSNIMFFSYVGLIFIIALVALIYLRVLLTDGDFAKQEKMNFNYNGKVLTPVDNFSVVYLKNVDMADLIQQDSFAVDIPDSAMIIRNDTLFVDNCYSVIISFKNIKSIIAKDNSSMNLVADNDDSLKIECEDSEINIAAVQLQKFSLISNGNSEINVAASKINEFYVDLIGENELSVFAKVNTLEGNNSEQSSITILPKPKNVNLSGNGELN